jgi:putative DNA primase/helicase
VTIRLVSDTVGAVTSLALLDSALRAPSWIECTGMPPATEVLACRNGLVHLPAVARGGGGIIRPTPRFFSMNALDYDYDPKAPEPKEWRKFLNQLWPNDPEAIGTLQEWFGYCLTCDTRQQKILMLVGPKRSGKGTIARVLRSLVGVANTAGPTLAGLGTNFGLAPLLGKSVAIISDARLSGRTDMAQVTERLLSISGEDGISIPRKFLPNLDTTLTARFTIMTNELPKLNDPSGALVGRLILLRLTESFYGKEDMKLTEKLLKEMPGILLWAIEGWRRLNERGHFIQPDSGKKLIEHMEDLSSPIGAFIREQCIVGAGCEVITRDLFKRWQEWCEGQGIKDHGTDQTFGRDLRAAEPGLNTRQVRGTHGRGRVYIGIRPRGELEE